MMYVRKEAVLSSQIEGTQSSLRDLLNAEARVLDPQQPKDVEEVVNYVAALNLGLSRLETLPVSLRLIREIHEQLLRGVRGSHAAPGELRATQNWIGPPGSSLSAATFVPPPVSELPQCLTNLERFLHEDRSLPQLIRIGVAHVFFETVHPFLDGNGRVGRLLITFLLCERQILSKPVLYLSHFFKKRRGEYYARLQAVRDEGDWEGWLRFFLEGVAEVSLEATETARRILVLREEHRSRILQNLGRAAGSGQQVLEHLYERPVVSVKDVQGCTGTSFAAANQLVARLESIGILQETTGNRRNRRFSYTPYIALFSEG